MRQLCIAITLLLCKQAAWCQPPAVLLTVDTTNIAVGEQLRVTLKADFKRGAATAFFRIDSIPHFEIIDRGRLDSQVTATGLELQQQLKITSWDSGQWKLPAFTLQDAVTRPVIINVGYTAFDARLPYHDVKPIIEVAPPDAPGWPWYAAGLGLLFLLGLLFFPRTKKKEPADGFLPHKGAYRKALKALQELPDIITTQEEGKVFFTQLVLVFRQYLRERRGIHSSAQTTVELAAQLQILPWPDGIYERLIQYLQLSDAVKFAKCSISTTDARSAKAAIEQSINAVEKMNDGI